MVKSLLSIDWDYFIPMKKEWCGSYIENIRNINRLWYRRYIKNKRKGKDIVKDVHTGPELNGFWGKIKRYFRFSKFIKVYVSDSHKLSFPIAKRNECSRVFLFDAHSDLGYGGIQSLDFELNCGNWLGKLLKDDVVEKANIIYSPYSYEKKEDFDEINKRFNIQYGMWQELYKKATISIVHICRSGAWTPPWLDDDFKEFIKSLKMPFRVIDCPYRSWNTKQLTLSDQINCMLD